MTCARAIVTARAHRAGGFTLIELALTIAIVAVLGAGLLVPVVSQIAQRNISSTERTLELAREALIGYAVANGRLPCPATDTSNGLESPSPPDPNGACTTYYGYLPAATLGLTPVDARGYAVDAWASSADRNRIRYAVSDFRDATTNPVFTRPGGMKTAGPAGLGGNDFLYVCNSGSGINTAAPNCGTATTLTSTAPAVIWSVGANAATGGGTSVDEAQNQFPGALSGGGIDRVFVSRGIASGAGPEYDDIVSWLSIGGLVSRMVQAGQLP